MMEDIIQAAGELLGYGMVFGFAVGAFLVLATSGLCSVLHSFKKIVS